MRNAFHLGLVAGIFGIVVLSTGCMSDESSLDAARARQDAAMQDPFSYGPKLKDMDPKTGKLQTAAPDPSGGDLKNFDKAGMKRDLDLLLNP